MNPSNNRKRKFSLAWWQLDIIISLALVVICGIWFLYNHAWGAWGDDAPGYIYTAGQILHHEPLVGQDSLVQQALKWFGQEKFARFTAPAHHEIISPGGWIASRYPIGLGLLMALVAWLSHWQFAVYLVVPVSAVVVVLATYWCSIVWLPLSAPLKRLAGIMAAASVVLCDVFANYAVAEPMREIPSIAFFLLGCLCLTIALFHTPTRFWKIVLLLLAGALYGYSVDIRETSAVLLPSILLLFFYGYTKAERSDRWRSLGIFFIGLILAGSVSIWTSVTISQHKVKFRDKDISSIAVTSNFDHIQSLSFTNLYDNEGKFRPGVGGVNQYWQVLQQFNIWPPFLFMAAVGLMLLWRSHRRWAIFFSTWFGAIFILFAMWINPYPRYILPLLPLVALLSAYGTLAGMQLLNRVLGLKPIMSVLLTLVVVASFFVCQQPAIANRQAFISTTAPQYKAINWSDTTTIQTVADDVQQYASTQHKPPLLLMLGSFKGGLAETIMTQTQLPVIRFPGKPNEQPPLDQLTQFVQQLNQTDAVVIWYDPTASSVEQQWFKTLSVQPINSSIYNFSFENSVTLYALTSNN